MIPRREPGQEGVVRGDADPDTPTVGHGEVRKGDPRGCDVYHRIHPPESVNDGEPRAVPEDGEGPVHHHGLFIGPIEHPDGVGLVGGGLHGLPQGSEGISLCTVSGVVVPVLGDVED